jgi:hypothetical protein
MNAFDFDNSENNSDMESVVEPISDVELEINNISENDSGTVDSLSWFDSIPESELNELETTVYVLIDDHLKDPAEIIKIMKTLTQST